MSGHSERVRYQRQMLIEGFGEEGQGRLARASVFVAGAGGLGCAVTVNLAAAGVGAIRFADNGRVELSNLNRQVLYCDKDIGRPKVEAMAERLAALNPAIRLEPRLLTMDESNLSAMLEGCVLAIDALDNLPTRFLLNSACIAARIPLVHGAVQGFSGQAMTVIPGDSACLECLFPRMQQLNVDNSVIGTAPAMIGSIEAAEAIRLITGLGLTLAGRLLVYDGLEARFHEIQVDRDPTCPACRDCPPNEKGS